MPLRHLIDNVLVYCLLFIVGLGSLITFNENACGWGYHKLESKEAISIEAGFWRDKADAPENFFNKHLPFLQWRDRLARLCSALNHSKLALEICQRSEEIYDQSPLTARPEYEHLVYLRGTVYHQLLDLPQARAAYMDYLARYPQGAYASELAASIKLIDAATGEKAASTL